eukprot:366422-Chlamydomonas_euryale.AAC.7
MVALHATLAVDNGCTAYGDGMRVCLQDPDSPLKATDFGLSIRHTRGSAKLTSRRCDQEGGRAGDRGHRTSCVHTARRLPLPLDYENSLCP